jgi:hypothetical protein
LLTQRAIYRLDVRQVEPHGAANLSSWDAIVASSKPQEPRSLALCEPKGDRPTQRRRLVGPDVC